MNQARSAYAFIDVGDGARLQTRKRYMTSIFLFKNFVVILNPNHL